MTPIYPIYGSRYLTRLIWIAWIVSRCPRKAVKFNHSLTSPADDQAPSGVRTYSSSVMSDFVAYDNTAPK